VSVWFVYVDRTDDERPFYVGKGTHKRVHTRERDNAHWKSIRDKHGWHREEVFGTKDEQAAYDFEADLIALHNTFHGWGANHTAGGSCGQTGLKRSAVSRLRMSIARRGQISWNKGVPQSEEHRRKNSECRIGKIRGPMPDETKAKIAKAHTGMKMGPRSREAVEKTRLANLGQKRSTAFRQVMSELASARSRWTAEIIESMRIDRANGTMLKDIAVKHNTSPATVCNLLKYGKAGRSSK